jgi:hypothetical protein
MKLAVMLVLALFVPACAGSLIGPASPADDPSWDRAQTPDDDVHWPAEQQALKHAIHCQTDELIFGDSHRATATRNAQVASVDPPDDL